MWLVAELFEQLPEVGDRDKPRLVFFLDEAHLLFEGASKAFVESDGADGAPHPLEGRRRLLRDADAEGRAGRRSRAARQPRAARAAGVHAGRREGAPRDGANLPEVGRLRPRGAPDPARDGRGGRDDPQRVGRADAGRAHAHARRRSRAWARRTTSPVRPPPARCYAKYGTRLDSQSAREMLAERLDPPAPGEPAPSQPTERQKGAGSTAAARAQTRSATSCSRRAAGR